MHSHKQLASIIDPVIISEQEQMSDIESSIIDEYKKLEEACIRVLKKNKTRKNKKNVQNSEE